MSDVIEIPAGSRVFLGAPANPKLQESVDLLRKLMSEEPGIIEGHIPQCYIPMMMTEPRQVLFIVCSSLNSGEQAVSSLRKHLTKAILQGGMVDIFPLTATHELVDEVRRAGCRIY